MTAIFEATRSMLFGLAYRILGSRADAEDAVQDTYVKWYVGAWLPEPLASAGDQANLASSLTTAFLLLLERLTPKERAAYLLHEIFELPYPEIARSLELEEAAGRKLVSRARVNVDRSTVRHVPSRDRQEQLLAAFSAAIVDGDAARFAEMLAADVELVVDSGGKVPALREVLHGVERVGDFVAQALRNYWTGFRLETVPLNDGLGVVVRHGDEIVAAVSFAFDDAGGATHVFIVGNPQKLARLASARSG